jgi:hypothetical protein
VTGRPPGRRLVPALLAALISGACGIEDYYYLYPVPPGNITLELNSRATLRLPLSPGQVSPSGEYYYFRHFSIYYRIYVSDVPESGGIQTSPSALSVINPTLASDYSRIAPYLSSETNVNTAIATLFKSMNYHPLALFGQNIDGVLDDGAVGKTIVISFPQEPASVPRLIIDNNAVALYRSNGDGLFNPRPDRYFVNSSPLSDPGNINSAVNADVADKSGASGPRYTYAAMFIVVTGVDPNFSLVFSTPTFIGIFRLPDPL